MLIETLKLLPMFCQVIGCDDFMEWQAYADKKPLAREFATFRSDRQPQHVFGDVRAFWMMDEHRKCFKCGSARKGTKKRRHCVSLEDNDDCTYGKNTKKPDCTLAGLPCQPFSPMRQTNGTTPGTSHAKGHSGYMTVMESWMVYLAEVKPRGFLVENCEAFGTKVNPASGLKYIEEFAIACETHGYACLSIVMDTSVWSEVSRTRICSYNLCVLLVAYNFSTHTGRRFVLSCGLVVESEACV